MSSTWSQAGSRTKFFSGQNNDINFIIDEAQVTYDDFHLWYTVIKSPLGLWSGPRFCLFSSYGSPTTGSPDYLALSTPPILCRQQRVSLITPPNSDEVDFVFFTACLNFKDVVSRFCRNPSVEFTLVEEVQDYIFDLTNGHPGMVSATLKFIYRACTLQLEYSAMASYCLLGLLRPLETYQSAGNHS